MAVVTPPLLTTQVFVLDSLLVTAVFFITIYWLDFKWMTRNDGGLVFCLHFYAYLATSAWAASLSCFIQEGKQALLLGGLLAYLTDLMRDNGM